MADVFISYSKKNHSRVALLARALDHSGFTVWWDRELLGGSQFGSEIYQKLAEAAVIVVLWTEESVQSDWVIKEATIGRSAGKLVPVRLDAIEVPESFDDLHTLDFANWSGEINETFRALSRSIRARIDATVSVLHQPSRSRGRLLLAGLLGAGLIVAGGATYNTLSDGVEARPITALMGIETESELDEQSRAPVDRRAIRQALLPLQMASLPQDAAMEALVRTSSFDGAFRNLKKEYDLTSDKLTVKEERNLLHQVAALAMEYDDRVALEIYERLILLNAHDRAALRQLARLYTRQSDYPAAKHYLERAREEPAYSEAERIDFEITSLQIESIWRDVKSTEFDPYIAEAESIGAETVWLRALHLQGEQAYSELESLPDEAMRLLKLTSLSERLQDIALAAENLDEIYIASLTYHTLIDSLLDLRQPERTLPFIEKSIAIAAVLNQPRNTYFVHNHMARYQISIGDLDLAASHLEKAEVALVEAGLGGRAFPIWQTRIDLAFAQGNTTLACRHAAKYLARLQAARPEDKEFDLYIPDQVKTEC